MYVTLPLTQIGGTPTKGISPSFYAIRWLTTLLSREFNLADTIRMWDSLWSDTDRHSFLSYLCCAMIIAIRDDILKGDFSENLCLLQAYPQSSSCDQLIELANTMRTDDVVNLKLASHKAEMDTSPTSVADRMFSVMSMHASSVGKSMNSILSHAKSMFDDEIAGSRQKSQGKQKDWMNDLIGQRYFQIHLIL